MYKRFLQFFVILLTTILIVNYSPTSIQAKEKRNITDSQVAVGTKGMVVTSHPLASKVGAEVLKKGGNAVDAAIAIQFALNVNEPMMSGIGGGGFMMVYEAKNHKITIIDSREKAPLGAKPDMFLDKNGKVIPFPVRSTDGKAVGVPGTLKGLVKAHEKWGTVPFKKLIDPSIRMAEKGVKVNWVLADAIKENEDKLSKTAAKEIFLPNGKPLKEGDVLVQKDLAKTFKLIRKNGQHAFYNGEIAKAISSVVQKNNGSMTKKDLKNYDVTIDQPIKGTYRGYEIASMPPPSSGGVTLLQILSILEGYDLNQYGVRSPEKYHLLTEAMHLAYADRGAYVGDPKFVDVPTKGMLNPDYINERRSQIQFEKANSDIKPGDPWKFQEGNGGQPIVKQPDDKKIGQTTHFTVADKWGNLVSYTTTIEQEFGTGIMVPGYGFLLNNELTDFDAVPGGANEVQPNKRPMSSMSPTIIFKDGKPVMTVGSPGGSTIIASVVQTIINSIDYHMNLKDAIEEPRIFSPSYPTINWEEGIPQAARNRLEEWGHKWNSKPQPIGNVQSMQIFRKPDFYLGAADSTRQGKAIGLFR
ncbi:gamma-glutamyltransferase [Fictibacillus sp. Mic-4]|uniref:gamma-glutamyltransferase n=1 Tax=Fictibacillus sp. Mic-4 TaxID=3132826 RepID=UPI003CF0B0F8